MGLSETYTVIIPAYNAEATIDEAVRSVLSQTNEPDHVIVVDDGSTDATAQVAGSFDKRVQLIRQANLGVAAATNVAIEAVKTPLMAALDADDIWLPHKMERQLLFLRENPSSGAVFSRGTTFRDANGTREQLREQDMWSRSSMVIRTSEAVANGPLMEPPAGLGDMIDWIARLRERGVGMALIPETLVLRRMRPDSLSAKRRETDNKGYVFVAREAILRRRAAAKSQD